MMDKPDVMLPARRNSEARAGMQDELATAAANGDTARTRELLDNGADVNGTNRFGRTPIQVMMMGSTPVARLLLSRGADPNVPDLDTGATPLHDAARAGFLDTVRALLEFNANPELKDAQHKTPAETALEHGHEPIAECLNKITSSTQQPNNP
ncbi:cyclin-dependent kinase 4 inhibitor B-like isoform X1 [Astyanax mexicanus]|uniref:Cyclin-dependent kinase 4 inhibitor B-like isoform X1 n=1 Tax=Astyanax mexicanus TaxID=7994 RepID=A0A8T2LWF2_ASTMX|nr:cyclin-dependent kinase 4 inhibitor B-like isoform X1 [Astyanax mexicanus]